jgi:hypothetical protein
VDTPINDGAACTPPLTTDPCRSGSAGTCQSGSCVPAKVEDGAYCAVAGSTLPPSVAQCLSDVDGTCQDGECVPDGLADGTSCDPGPDVIPCQTGECRSGVCTKVDKPDGVECGQLGGDKCVLGTCRGGTCTFVTSSRKTCPDACGDGTTCDAATGTCPGSTPSFGQTDCGGFIRGHHPEWCCPGQLCICPPTATGIPNFCIQYGCWNPEDVPGPPRDIPGTPR